MKTIISTLLMASSIVLVSSAQGASIDDFNDDAQQIISADGSSYINYDGAIGGGRFISISKTELLGANAAITTGMFTHSSDAMTPATYAITWDVNDASLGGVDLTDGGFIAYLVLKF